MGCMEQAPINAEVTKTLGIPVEEIDAIKNPGFIADFHLKATPTIIVLVNNVEKERFEGVVHVEQMETTLKKYL
jgi:thioredoxin 1